MSRIESLYAELEAAQRTRKRPPVHLWHPQHSGSIDIRIAADGTWYHEGTAFTRPALVSLFASILRRDGDTYYLVTPAERLEIQVDDVPFVGVAVTRDGEGEGQRLLVTTNLGEHVPIDDAHPLRLQRYRDADLPYIEVRDRLLARLGRALYYELVELGSERNGHWAVRSCGAWHALGKLDGFR